MIDLEEKQKTLGLSEVPVLSLVAEARTITVLTLNDGLLVLEEDATVLDCAYRIHSEIFQHCQGAIINGRTVHLQHST
jgi:(p)ppGpp synthase/HD superfamily hydrolase